MKTLTVNKSYDYQKVLAFANKNNMEVEEIGEDCIIGESFIILRDYDSDKVISLTMTGYKSASGALYKVCYNDLSFNRKS